MQLDEHQPEIVDEDELLRRAAEASATEEEEALDRLLDVEPLSVRGHIRKAACRARAGDDAAARFLYAKALKLAGGQRLPDLVRGDVRDAAATLAGLQAKSHAERDARLRQRGLAPDAWSPRFRHALDLAAGRRTLYAQEPTAFAYPGLPHIPFFDPASWAWAAKVEAAAGAIRDELTGLLETDRDAFRAYIQSDRGSGPLGGNKALLNNADWSVLALCENGWLTPELIKRCPRTWAAVLAAPVPRISGWGPTVVFSLLKAGARIAPHTGMFNTRLICHLPLIVPPGCRFRVGDEVREWQVGKLMIFDDTIEHEAWNEGSGDRVVLIFDIWRPELTETERHELTALFSD